MNDSDMVNPLSPSGVNLNNDMDKEVEINQEENSHQGREISPVSEEKATRNARQQKNDHDR